VIDRLFSSQKGITRPVFLHEIISNSDGLNLLLGKIVMKMPQYDLQLVVPKNLNRQNYPIFAFWVSGKK
jgi:hypothetical protein